MYIGTRRVCNNPCNAVLVVVEPIVIVSVVQTTPHIVVFPQHDANLIVNAYQLSQVRHQQYSLLTTGVAHDAEFLRKLTFFIAKRNIHQLLGGWVIDEIAFVE